MSPPDLNGARVARLFGTIRNEKINSKMQPNPRVVNPKEVPDENSILLLFLSFSPAEIEAATKMNFHRFDAKILEKMKTYFPEYKVTRLPTKFDTSQHYLNSFVPLILVETWANLVSDYTDKSRLWGQERKKKNCFYLPTGWAEKAMHFYANLISIDLESHKKIDTSDESNPLLHQLALLEYRGRSWLVFVLAIVSSQMKGDICIVQMKKGTFYQLQATIPKSNLPEVTLKPFYYLKQCLRQMNTLAYLKCDRRCLLDKIKEPNLKLCTFDTENIKFTIHEEEDFNTVQRDTIVACLNALDRQAIKVQLIQGPPGTGKTSTLVGLVKNIFANFRSRPSDPIRLLICAPSNGAIDNVGRKLLEEKHKLVSILHRPIVIVRVGYLAKVHKDMHHVHIKTLTEGKNMENRQRVLKSADIILSTLGSCHHPDLLATFRDLSKEYLSRNLPFRAVIIDEAGQATEPELLMPFIYNVDKFILIGDHCQLPPTVISSLASSNNYGRSLFERFYQCFRSQFDNAPERVPIITLTTQYRMHPQIVAMPSKLFYKGQLHTNDGTGVNESINLRPYFIFNLPYFDEKASLGHSKVNSLEVTFIRKLLVSVLEECGFPLSYLIEKAKEEEMKMMIQDEDDGDVQGTGNKDTKEEEKSKTNKEEINEAQEEEDKDKTEKEEINEAKEEEEEDKGKTEKEEINKAKEVEEEKTKSDIGENPKAPTKYVPLTISIITFYQGQKSALIKEFKYFQNGILLNEININTIDAFQGQEADIVILSTVRTSKSIGFLRSCQRLNVAMTRARSCLYVCMHAKAFEKEKNWKDLVVDAEKRGILEPVTEHSTVESIRLTVADQCTDMALAGDDAVEPPTLLNTLVEPSSSVDNLCELFTKMTIVNEETIPKD